jgi:DNA-binding NtrC family response regulator
MASQMAQENVNGKKVLIVEDEPIIGRLCQKTLKASGYEVDIAINGLVAKKMVGEKSYDICISDIRTPEMDGIQLFEYLEREHRELISKMIFTSGDILSNNVEQFLKRAARPFLPKPFSPDELRKIITQIN